MESQEQSPKLLDQVRSVMRLHHYSIHTERTYIEWIKRYIHFHRMRSREDLAGGEGKIEAFLTDLAMNGKVAPSTQNQAMNALVFLYRQVLKVALNEKINAVRAERKVNVPVVLTREEVAKVVNLMEGESQLIVKLLYGSGLRIMEAVRLRIKDVDFAMKQVTVRSGKGDKDRFTTLPSPVSVLTISTEMSPKVRCGRPLACAGISGVCGIAERAITRLRAIGFPASAEPGHQCSSTS
jgi:site-specific recombinase XerD